MGKFIIVFFAIGFIVSLITSLNSRKYEESASIFSAITLVMFLLASVTLLIGVVIGDAQIMVTTENSHTLYAFDEVKHTHIHEEANAFVKEVKVDNINYYTYLTTGKQGFIKEKIKINECQFKTLGSKQVPRVELKKDMRIYTHPFWNWYIGHIEVSEMYFFYVPDGKL